MSGSPERPDEGQPVSVETTLQTCAAPGGPQVEIVMRVVGVRRYAVHRGEAIPYIEIAGEDAITYFRAGGSP